MLFGFLLPSNLEFYAHYEQSHHWQQILRFLDDPSGMLDPIGLGISKESLVAHLLQVVHTSAGYDWPCSRCSTTASTSCATSSSR